MSGASALRGRPGLRFGSGGSGVDVLATGAAGVGSDVVAARAMGYDPMLIPMIREALGGALLPSGEIAGLERVLDGPEPARAFKPPRSWPSLLPRT